MGSKKKRNAGKKQRQRPGVSGNPAVRAAQAGTERGSYLDREDPVLPVLGLGPGGPEMTGASLSSLMELGRLQAMRSMEARATDWWPESHDNLLARAEGIVWPAGLPGIEEVASALIAEQLRDNYDHYDTGHKSLEWLGALAEYTLADMQESFGGREDDDWPWLWALMRAIVLTTPQPAGSADEIGAEDADEAAEELAQRGLLPSDPLSGGWPMPRAWPAGTPQLARDSYGSRFLVAVPFGYAQAHYGLVTDPNVQPTHWYAWDVDTCGQDQAVSADSFGSAAEALAEWRSAAGPTTDGAELADITLSDAARLLDSCTGDVSDYDGDPVVCQRDFFRMRRRAAAIREASLLAPGSDTYVQGLTARFSGTDGPGYEGQAMAGFTQWHSERLGTSADDGAMAVRDAFGVLISSWGPDQVFDERAFYACSPHRVECTAFRIDEFGGSLAGRAIALLPDWVRYCAERTGTSDEAAAPAIAAARAAVKLAEAEGPGSIPDPAHGEPAFRRVE